MGTECLHPGFRWAASARCAHGRSARPTTCVHRRTRVVRTGLVPGRYRTERGLDHRCPRIPRDRRRRRRPVLARADHRCLPSRPRAHPCHRRLRHDRRARREPGSDRRRRTGLVGILAGRVLHQRAHRDRDDRARGEIPAQLRHDQWPLRPHRRHHLHRRHGRIRLRDHRGRREGLGGSRDRLARRLSGWS